MVKSVSKTYQRHHDTIHMKDSWFSIRMQVPRLVRVTVLDRVATVLRTRQKIFTAPKHV